MEAYFTRVKGELDNVKNYLYSNDDLVNKDKSDSSASGSSGKGNIGSIQDDDESDDEEMDRIGRLPTLNDLNSLHLEIPGLMTLDHYHWLIKRYLHSWGEPKGIEPAVEPTPSKPLTEVRTISDAPSEVRNTQKIQHLRRISNAKEKKLLTEPELRQKIMHISSLGLSDRERDIQVQRLMTENYYRINGLVLEDDDDHESTVGRDSLAHLIEKAKKELDADPAQLIPTHTSFGSFGCEHYSRACKLQCPTCSKFYTCRLCHDEEVLDHNLDRGATDIIMCMRCQAVQSPSAECENCHKEFAFYYCEICKLWENNEHGDNPIYHCAECGLCRIGEGLGIDYFHCKTCNVCMSLELEDNHKCIEHSTECDCPICGEFMFTSRETVVFMKCGHSIHQSCFDKHTRNNYKCPTCARTIINMAAQFRILDSEIEATPMPEPFNEWKSIIICNDCSAKSSIPFHVLGLKCENCGSYNTAQERLSKPSGEDAVDEDEVLRRLAVISTATDDDCDSDVGEDIV